MAPNPSKSGAARLPANSDVPVKPIEESLIENEPVTHNQHSQPTDKYEWQIVWRNVVAFIYLHSALIYGLFMTNSAKPQSILFAVFYSILAAYGITAGAHRLWSHKCYKANTALRIFLAFCNTGAFQNHIYEWSRDHRVHHKFTDTDADPHNSRRGFFFAHIGWLMLKKHPDVKRKGQLVDMSDLEQDWVVMFQRKYYMILMPICTFLIPVMIPMYCWGETLNIAFHLNLARYTFGLNFTWLVNSAAHIWGNRPYDRSISPTENVYVGVLAFGEGWHNYHHAFPWDYKTSELSGYRTNFTTAFIDLFARFGWAYDLKTVRPDMIRKRAARTGDGTYHTIHGGPWGWGDPDLTKDDKDVSEVINSIED